MQGLADQQEIMGALADCIMEVYALESCILRAEKLIAAKGEAAAQASHRHDAVLRGQGRRRRWSSRRAR